ncbi:MAG: hypothetical protein HYZ53_30970 [Planctomycetes bacterium]|nr:hypothetical protein [Planctomycetota bacterium]
MPGDEVQRLFYRARQLLTPEDLLDEQRYHMEMRRRHAIGEHTWGIVSGLTLVKRKAEGAAGPQYFLEPGMAVDGFGREILVLKEARIDEMEFVARGFREKQGAFVVWVTYHRLQANVTGAGTDPEAFSRWTETYRLLLGDQPAFPNPPKPSDPLPDDPEKGRWPVPVGRLFWDGGKIVDADNGARKHVGVVAEEVRPPSDAAQLRIAAAVARFAGDAAVRGRVTVGRSIGDGRGRLVLEANENDSSLVTKTADENRGTASHDLVVRTNDGKGGNRVVVDKDLFRGKSILADEALVTQGDLSVQNQAIFRGKITVDLRERGVMQEGRDALHLLASPNQQAATILTNKQKFALVADAGHPADLWLRHVEAEGDVQTRKVLPRYTTWSPITPTEPTGGAAIVNDNDAYKELMVVGNYSADGARRKVGLYDDVTTHGDLEVRRNLGVQKRFTAKEDVVVEGNLTVRGLTDVKFRLPVPDFRSGWVQLEQGTAPAVMTLFHGLRTTDLLIMAYVRRVTATGEHLSPLGLGGETYGYSVELASEDTLRVIRGASPALSTAASGAPVAGLTLHPVLLTIQLWRVPPGTAPRG